MGLNYQAQVNINAAYTGEAAVNKAKSDFLGLNKSVESIKGNLGFLTDGLKALAGAFAVKSLYDYTKGIIDTADKLNDLSTSTGLTVESLDQLKGSAQDNGANFEEVVGSLKKFTANLALHRKELSSVGVTSKDATTALNQLSDRFNALPGPQEKAALAIKVFGKSGTDMVRVLGDGSAALKKFGSGFTGDFAHQADAFNDSLGQIQRNVNRVSVAAIGEMLPSLRSITEGFKELTQSGPDTNSFFEDFGKALKVLAVAGVAAVESLIEGFDTLYTVLKEIGLYIGTWAAEIVDAATTAGHAVKEAFSGNFDQVKNLGSELSARLSAANNEVAATTDKLTADLEARTKARIDTVQRFSAKVFANPPAPDSSKLKTGTQGLGDYAEQAKKAADAIKDLNRQTREYTETQELELNRVNLSELAYQKELLAIKEKYEVEKATKDLLPEQAAAYKKQADALLAVKEHYLDAADAQKKLFSTGAKEAIKDYVAAAQDMATQTKNLFSHAFSGIEDALVSFVQTGKLNFADLARSIEADLIRIAVRQAVLAPILGAVGSLFSGSPALAGAPSGLNFSSANGNIMTSRGPVQLNSYANGGVATRPTLSLFGEGSTPEAYVPLPDGRSIPVSMKGNSSGTTNVSVNINMASDGSTSGGDTKSDSEKGKQLGNLVVSAVQAELVKQKRPGGLLAS